MFWEIMLPASGQFLVICLVFLIIEICLFAWVQIIAHHVSWLGAPECANYMAYPEEDSETEH